MSLAFLYLAAFAAYVWHFATRKLLAGRVATGLLMLAVLVHTFVLGMYTMELGLPPMVQSNTSSHHTNFTVSIEAAEGVTTGISAYDRAHTIRTAVRPNAAPADLAQPGHIFPLTAQPGGVLARAGHTEAAADLAMMAGLEPAGVLVEILNPDGTMARRPELEVFAREHGLKMGSIEALIRHRLETEHTVERVDSRDIETEHGPFRLHTYHDRLGHALAQSFANERVSGHGQMRTVLLR